MLGLELLERQPLMRRMGIDDHQAAAGLGKNVGLVELGAGGAERPVDKGFLGRRQARPWSAAGSPKPMNGSGSSARPGSGADARRRCVAGSDGHRHRPHGAERARRQPRGAARSGRRNRLAEGSDDQRADQHRIAEAHLGLGRMDIDVDHLRRAADEQSGGGMAPAHHQVGIGAADRARHQPVAHRAAVDEQIELRGLRPMIGGQAGKARQADAVALGRDCNRARHEVAAHDLADALLRRLPGEVDELAAGQR